MLRSQFQGEAAEVASNPTPIAVAPSPTATPVPIPTHTPTSEPTPFPTLVVPPTATVTPPPINSSGVGAAIEQNNPPTNDQGAALPAPNGEVESPPISNGIPQSGGVLSTGNGIFWALAGIVTLLLMAFGVFNHQQRSH